MWVQGGNTCIGLTCVSGCEFSPREHIFVLIVFTVCKCAGLECVGGVLIYSSAQGLRRNWGSFCNVCCETAVLRR